MRFVDPRPPLAVAAEPYDLSMPLTADTRVTVYANGFPDSVAFAGHVADAVQRQCPGVDVAIADKGNASRLASTEEVEAIAAGSDAAITLYGH